MNEIKKSAITKFYVEVVQTSVGICSELEPQKLKDKNMNYC